MFASALVETVIGVVLIFLIMSLLCSALREGWESFFKQRALDLERGIRELLQDPHGDGLAQELYSHPLVYGLFAGRYQPGDSSTWLKRWFGRGGNLPSYIPNESFARALLDLEQQGRIDNPAIVGVIRSLAQETGEDVAQLRANVEAWFNASAERIGGWYKRRTQALLFALGFASAVALNVNPIEVGSTLYRHADLREAVVSTAENFASTVYPKATGNPRQAFEANVAEMHKIAAAGVPVGWSDPPTTPALWVLAIFGWFLTALAVTLGAPFWFDLLNKFVILRSTMKPKKPEAERADEKPAPARVTVAVPTEPGKEVTASVVKVNRAAIPLPLVASAFEAHSWQNGEEDGVL